MVILGEKALKVAKLVDSAIWGILKGPKSPKSFHKLLLPKNVSRSAFYSIILREMGPKVARLVNAYQILISRPLRPNSPMGRIKGPRIS